MKTFPARRKATCRFGAEVGHDSHAFSRVALASGLSLGFRGPGEAQGTSAETPGRHPTSEMLLTEPSGS